MQALNLPGFDFQIKQSEGKVWIFDVIRKKFVVLTPEEWVRQHVINYFIDHLKYPKSLLKIESGLTFNQLQKRSDIIVYSRSGKPWLLAECKSFDVALDQKSVQQVAVYNASVKATYMVLSNGMKHICFQTDDTGVVKQLQEFPLFG